MRESDDPLGPAKLTLNIPSQSVSGILSGSITSGCCGWSDIDSSCLSGDSFFVRPALAGLGFAGLDQRNNILKLIRTVDHERHEHAGLQDHDRLAQQRALLGLSGEGFRESLIRRDARPLRPR